MKRRVSSDDYCSDNAENENHIINHNINKNVILVGQYSLCNILLDDNIRVIFTYLKPKDLFAFKFTCKRIWKLADTRPASTCINQRIRTSYLAKSLKYLRAHLASMGILRGMENLLHYTGGFIAGEYLLMSLYREVNTHMQFNILIPNMPDINLATISKLKFQLLVRSIMHASFFGYVDSFWYCSDQDSKYAHSYKLDKPYIMASLELWLRSEFTAPDGTNKFKLNLVFTECDDIPAYIKRNFEFSFTQVYTDLKTLCCESLAQILLRIGYVSNANCEDSKQYFAKYIQKYKALYMIENLNRYDHRLYHTRLPMSLLKF